MPVDGLTPADDLASVALDRAWPPPGWKVEYLHETRSTQDVALKGAREGALDRTVYVAGWQTAGRGRQGRQWNTPPGTALTLSVLFREAAAVRPTPHRYTVLASMALAEAIERGLGMSGASIKWPNDLLLNEKKVAGVLAESTWDGEWLAVVVGVGINVSTSAEGLADAFPKATSLHLEGAMSATRGALLKWLVEKMDVWLGRPPVELFEAWNQRLWRKGQSINLRGLEHGPGDSEREVVVLGVQPDGALRVRLEDGREVRTTSAEIIL